MALVVVFIISCTSIICHTLISLVFIWNSRKSTGGKNNVIVDALVYFSVPIGCAAVFVVP